MNVSVFAFIFRVAIGPALADIVDDVVVGVLPISSFANITKVLRTRVHYMFCLLGFHTCEPKSSHVDSCCWEHPSPIARGLEDQRHVARRTCVFRYLPHWHAILDGLELFLALATIDRRDISLHTGGI